MKSFASSEDSVGEHRDPEQRVMSDMEEFYNNNYRNHEVHELTNIFQERIWSISYDQHIDMIYIFIAKINQMSGYKELKFEVKNHQGVKKLNVSNANKGHGSNEKGIYFDINSLSTDQGQNNSNGVNNHPEERALQIYKSCNVDLELRLQIWNVDDRIIKDKDHRRRPQSQF